MDNLQHVISIPTMADLKTTKGNTNSAALLLGRDTPGDGKGGLYRWQSALDTTEDLTYMEIIAVIGATSGRWVRMFLNAVVTPHGILINNGGLKTFFSTASYTINSSSECSINLTLDNTTGGTAMFSEIWWNVSRAITTVATANDVITSNPKQPLPAGLKSTTHIFARGNSTTLGGTLASLFGLVIPGLRNAVTNTPVQFQIIGI